MSFRNLYTKSSRETTRELKICTLFHKLNHNRLLHIQMVGKCLGSGMGAEAETGARAAVPVERV